ncbi:MAG: hypothetical protein AB7C92_07370 [Synergistaceae bacterium]
MLRIAVNLPGESSGGEFKIYDLGANSPLNDLFSKFTSDDSREFPATGTVANSPADEFSACFYKHFARHLHAVLRNFNIWENHPNIKINEAV